MNDILTNRTLAVLLLVFFQPVISLQCYSCNSMSDVNCGDVFKVLPSEATYCPSGSRCVKFRGYRGTGSGSPWEVIRYCSLEFETNGCRDFDKNGISGEACVCNQEYCNFAGSLRHNNLILWTVLFLPCMLRLLV